jgi:2-methylcitrate dehydratase PrpD
MGDAISIAAFSAPVAALRGLTEHGSAVPLHGGLAARTALEAVKLAQAGLCAGANILEGGADPGLIELLRGDASVLEPETWRGEMLDGVYFKPLPACRHAQPAIEAILAILNKHKLDHRAIREVRVATYPMALVFGQPPRPEHELYDRLMSMPWAIASCLVHGGFGFDNVVAPARDARVEALYPRIRMSVDAEAERQYPGRLCTRVEVEFEGGEVLAGECRMEYGMPAEAGLYSPRGTTTPPLDDAGMRRKFFDLACRRIRRDEAEALLDEIFESEKLT